MQRKLRKTKSGEFLVSLPRSVCEVKNWTKDDTIDFTIKGDGIFLKIKKVKQ